jgi:Tol biopolymer transport system component
MAQPFDAKRLQITGEAFPIAEQIGPQGQTSIAPVSVSQTGILAYASGGSAPVSQLTWYDRRGTQLGTPSPQSTYRAPALSPDEKRIAVERIDSQTGTGDIWVLDIARGSFSRFTSDPATDMAPIWSPDGSRIVFLSGRDGAGNLYQKPSSGPGKEELLLKTNEMKIPTDWSRDGRFILYESNSPKTKFDIWVLPLAGDRKPIPFLQTEFDERHGQFSPNGKWVAYASNESGIFQIYVQPFPATGVQSMVSIDGGDQPAWRRDGRELFYLGLDRKLMSVEVKTDRPTFEAGVPKPLFESPVPTMSALRNYYCPSADGQRFLFYAPILQSNVSPIMVVVNWTAELKR